MKIKYLKIRNIASIEKADIDFENDLRNPGSQTSAPLFLITGDTGAGKSVILDCISMALYGTTPRVKGVVNRSNNTFFGSDGNEIKIHDISQYTRLGISSKEDCYSELHFEGNDGKNYISRFSLGIVRTGNFRPVGWRLQVGNSEVIEGNKKEEIKKRIVDAVGLTYEQFCRMAMLAQGQFADFLMGAKDERERILEQLTSTQHFSRYGEAIERIFKRAKQKKEETEKILETEKGHLLNNDEEKEVNETLLLLQKNMDSLRKQKEETETIISLLSNLETREEERDKISKDLEILKAKEKSDDFKTKRDILHKWDSTTTERTLLNKKWDIASSLDNCTRNYLAHLNSFHTLSSDLLNREETLNKKREDRLKLTEHLKEYDPYKEIYGNIILIKEKFTQRRSLIADLDVKNRELEEANGATDSLNLLLKKAIELAENAQSSLKEEKEKIDHLNSERDSLNPESTANKLEKANEEKSRLALLATTLDAAHLCAENLEKSITEKERISEETERLKADTALSQNEKDRIAKLYEEALQRYNTMHLSVEENFNALRHRLAMDKADSCPLCGQAKEWHNSDSELTETLSLILSPLESERDRLHKENLEAEKKYKENAKVYNQFTGMLKTQDENLTSLRKQYEKIMNDLIRLMEDVGIPHPASNYPDHPSSFPFNQLKNAINTQKESIDKNIAQLTEVKKKADNLQKEINKKLIECGPLEKTASKRETERNEADTNLRLNIEKISGYEKIILELKPKIEAVERDIDILISGYTKEWRVDPEAVLLKIINHSEDYQNLVNDEKKMTDEISDYSRAVAYLRTFHAEINDIAESLPDLLAQKRPVSDPAYVTTVANQEFDNLGKEWRVLLAEMKTEQQNIIKERTALSETESKLSEYYKESDTTEEILAALVKLEMAIPAIRNSVSELTLSVSSKYEALKSTQTAIEDLLYKLKEKTGAERKEDFPLRRDLEVNKSAIEAKLEEALRESGTARERLQQNEKNKERVEIYIKTLEERRQRFEEWGRLNRHFGGSRFRTLVQSYILRPLLRNANIYLRRITDHFTLTCSEQNEQLSILVLDRYNKNKIRSATVLSGGERFMISLALSLALSAMNKPGLNIDILFIDEGFGTLDSGSLNAVVDTLRRLPEIAGQNSRRVGVISHREELADSIDVQIRVNKCGEGRSRVEVISGNI